MGAKIAWQDFALSGYGIADLVMVSCASVIGGSTALTTERLRRQRLTAFELKLTNWRKALIQAHRYRYFSDRVLVVLPGQTAEVAAEHLGIFRSLDVGLWGFDSATSRIRKHYTPSAAGRAKNPEAREKALGAILTKVQLCKALKHLKAAK